MTVIIMKTHFLYLLLCLLCLSGITHAQSSLIFIRNEVRNIDEKLSTYVRSTRELEGLSLEGGEGTYYHSGDYLKKVDAVLHGEYGRTNSSFYYSGNELIFAYIVNTQYDATALTNPNPKVVSRAEQRLYFSGGKMVRYQEDTKLIPKEDPMFPTTERETLSLSAEFIKAYQPKK